MYELSSLIYAIRMMKVHDMSRFWLVSFHAISFQAVGFNTPLSSYRASAINLVLVYRSI